MYDMMYDMNPLRNLGNLTTLDITGCPADLTTLGELNLTTLSVDLLPALH